MALSSRPSPRDAGVASRMRLQKSKNTSPEIRLVEAFRRRNFKVETHPEDLPGRPDIVLPNRRLAVFVHGCFWHGCPRPYTEPKHNRNWWRGKIAKNKDRDRRKRFVLRRAGWSVISVWEHEDPDVAVQRIRSHLRKLEER